MKSVQQSAGNQVLWPHHTGGPDKESPTESSQAKSSQLCGQHKRDVETEAIHDAIIDLKHHDGVQGVRRANGNVSHNVHQCVLLDIPGSRIEREFQSTEPSR